jgi:hypothetical protein
LDQTIILQTVPGDQIPPHIILNARCRNCDRLHTYAELPEEAYYACQCEEPDQVPVFGTLNEFDGDTVAICGAGPSLNDAYRVIRKATHVWGCNRAANFLESRKWKLTHAVGIDAGTAMYEDCWATPPKVSIEYILASNVHPRLVDELLTAGQRVRFFHSIRGGIDEEVQWYTNFFPPCPIVGQGLNVVNRAVELAMFLGYKRVYVCGADNALGDSDTMYADGSSRDGQVILNGEVHGRKWRTTPDMLMSATNLARMKWAYGGRLELVGNTLPRALSLTDDKFLDKCVRWATPEEAAIARADETATVAHADGTIVPAGIAECT